MKKVLLIGLVLVTGLFLASFAQAQVGIESQPLNSKFKLQAYSEFISFEDSDINEDTWGAGILARYMFYDWLGAQTTFTFYQECATDNLDDDLEFNNWRLSLLVLTPLSDITEQLYAYAGAGIGVQFNGDAGVNDIDEGFTGHGMIGLGYDFPENFHIEIEAGYQFGNADVSNFHDDDIGLQAIYSRAGIGIRF